MANPGHMEFVKQGVTAWNKWREKHPAVRPDLQAAELNGSYLNFHNFRKANLRGVNLSFAEIWSADLDGADLHDTDLSDADLYFTELSNANLRKVRLDDAKLRFVNLEGADLSGAVMARTIILGTDLSRTEGLDEVVHRGASSIDSDVFDLTANGLSSDPSRQNEVEQFYRNAGVSEHLILYYRTRIGKPVQFYSVFISHSHHDNEFARYLYQALQRHGIRCWLDEHQILPGEDIYDAVEHGIRYWDKFFLCCSKSSLTSWWVDNEIDIALQKERELMKTRGRKEFALIPLNIDDYMFRGEWQSGKAQQIRSRIAADFRGWEMDAEKFDKEVTRLIQALQVKYRSQPEN